MTDTITLSFDSANALIAFSTVGLDPALDHNYTDEITDEDVRAFGDLFDAQIAHKDVLCADGVVRNCFDYHGSQLTFTVPARFRRLVEILHANVWTSSAECFRPEENDYFEDTLIITGNVPA